MQNKFKEGDLVFSVKEPDVKLVVMRYFARLYYCKVQKDTGKKEFVYVEKQLMPEASSALV